MAKKKNRQFQIVSGGKVSNAYPIDAKMKFEFDENKSQRNLEKHGIDFVEAQELWDDSRRIEIAAECKGEPRFVTFASYAGAIWVAVITYRRNAIRIISVRRATREEASIYGQGNHN